jgi:hypothetical protein
VGLEQQDQSPRLAHRPKFAGRPGLGRFSQQLLDRRWNERQRPRTREVVAQERKEEQVLATLAHLIPVDTITLLAEDPE